MKPTKSKTAHYPDLSTFLEVETVLKNSELPISKEELKRRLRAKIMHQTLNIILSYMEYRGMIFSGKKGITWTYSKLH